MSRPCASAQVLAFVRNNQIQVARNFEVERIGAKLSPSQIGIIEQDIFVVPHGFSDREILMDENDFVIAKDIAAITVAAAVAMVTSVVVALHPVGSALAPHGIFP